MLDPDAGSLVGEVWHEFVPTKFLPELEKNYQHELSHLPAPEEGKAREYLLGIITARTTPLEEQLQKCEKRDKLKRELDSYLLAFDSSKEGALQRRYGVHLEKQLKWHMEQINMRHSEEWQKGQVGHGGLYYRPSASWFQSLDQRPGHAGKACDGELRPDAAHDPDDNDDDFINADGMATGRAESANGSPNAGPETTEQGDPASESNAIAVECEPDEPVPAGSASEGECRGAAGEASEPVGNTIRPEISKAAALLGTRLAGNRADAMTACSKGNRRWRKKAERAARARAHSRC